MSIPPDEAVSRPDPAGPAPAPPGRAFWQVNLVAGDDPRHDLDGFHGTPRPYVIAATPRSGSSLLSDLLRATGLLGVPLEYLNQVDLPVLLARFGGATADGRIDFSRYLAGLVRHRTSPNGRFGLKVHFRQIQPHLGDPALARLLRAASWLWIRRRDTIAQAISLAIAQATATWSIRRDEERRAAPAPFDGAQFTRETRGLAIQDMGWRLFFRANGIAPLEVWYEDLVADPDWTMAAACRYLGVEPRHTPRIADAGVSRQRDATYDAWLAELAASVRLAPRPD